MDIWKPIKNTPKIKSLIQECLDLKSDSDHFDNQIDKEYISLEYLKNLKTFWNKNCNKTGKKVYLNELLVNNELYLAKLNPPERNPEFVAHMEKLKAKIEEENYQNMVSNINQSSSLKFASASKSYSTDFRTVQGQIVSIINIVAVVGGAFMFGYKAVQYSLDEPNLTKQMIGGLILALIVAIADIYFLFKRLIKLDNKRI